MLDPRDYEEVEAITEEHIGCEAALKFVNYGEYSEPTFGVIKRQFNRDTGEPDGFALVSEHRHHLMNALFPQQDAFISSDTETIFYINTKESPNA